MEASPLKLHKAFYNRKAKAASFCISGFVSAHKPFRQFLHIHGQLIPRDIFQDDLRLISLIIEIQVGPCPGQRIFANVGQEIFQAAVGLFPVQLQMDLLLWNRNPAVDLRFIQPVLQLESRLPHQLGQGQHFLFYLNISAVRLAHLEKILDELFQTKRFPVQNINILLSVLF